MFTGEYNYTIDPKGRLIIPNKFRSLLGESFHITKGLDGCLTIYDNARWAELENKVKELAITDKKARTFKRFIIGGGEECSTDKMGRVLLPQNLRKFADLDLEDENGEKKEKEVVVVGVGDYIEIWNSKLYAERNDFEDFDELAESMEGLGI